MKKIGFALIAILFSSAIFAQITDAEKDLKTQNTDTVEGWKKGGLISLNFGQVSLSNWAAGGQNSFSANGLVSLFANYKKDNYTWDNSLDIGYGLLKQGEDSDIMKTDDKIDFASKYGKKAFNNFYYAALLNFKTQMTAGYDYEKSNSIPISNLLAPAYVLSAIGLDYKPNDNFSAFIAPITSKITIVNDEVLSDAGAFGVDSGSVVRSEFGGYLRLTYKKDLMKNVTLATKLDLFSNYIESPTNIDVSWETLISMKVNKFITATVFVHLVYDDDTHFQWTDSDGNHDAPLLQSKEVVGVGFAYKF